VLRRPLTHQLLEPLQALAANAVTVLNSSEVRFVDFEFEFDFHQDLAVVTNFDSIFTN
jgi:hypothetical protein